MVFTSSPNLACAGLVAGTVFPHFLLVKESHIVHVVLRQAITPFFDAVIVAPASQGAVVCS